MKKLIIAMFALAAIATAPKVHAQTKKENDAAMYPTKNIIENAVNSNDHKTLVAAVKAAGLKETIKDKGPFTVFAPTDEAFGKLPAGTGGGRGGPGGGAGRAGGGAGRGV